MRPSDTNPMKMLGATLLPSVLGLILSGCATAPQIPVSEKSYTVIFDVKSVDKNELFVRANTWFVANFVNAESVIQFSDKENGKIAGKYYSELTVGLNYYGVKQMIEVDVKDEKVRIMFENPTTIYLGNAFGPKGKVAGFDWGDVYEQKEMDAINSDWRRLAVSLNERLNKKDSW